MAPKKILVLGGGPGGVVAASNLAKRLSREEAEITIIDKHGFHVFMPSQLWIMTGQREPDDIRRPLKLLEKRGIRVLVDEVKSIKPEEHSIITSNDKLDYDYLVVALGSTPDVSKAPGYEFNVCTPWTIDGALKCRELLRGFKKGSIVVVTMSWPYKCPPAPFEAAFMVKYLLEQRGHGRDVDVNVIHFWSVPMEPFGPMMSAAFKRFMDQYGIGFIGKTEVEAFKEKHIETMSGEKIKYDIAIAVPPHTPPEPILNSDLSNPQAYGYMKIDKMTLRLPGYDNVYGIGDVIAPSLGIGMAGVFAHFQAEYVASNIIDDIKGTYMGEHYNMSGVCVMDMGYVGAAVYCDFTKRILEDAYPDCVMLGGMRAFRAVKYAFERYWLDKWF
ncbi:MAG: FAD/NAD(P)-binding oxidoreductase [Acidilobaceae archaeon]